MIISTLTHTRRITYKNLITSYTTEIKWPITLNYIMFDTCSRNACISKFNFYLILFVVKAVYSVESYLGLLKMFSINCTNKNLEKFLSYC